MAANGRRCTERVFLEFHHDEPYAIGGEPTVTNISLRCRAHNVYEAELLFGPWVAESPGNELAPGRASRGTWDGALDRTRATTFHPPGA